MSDVLLTVKMLSIYVLQGLPKPFALHPTFDTFACRSLAGQCCTLPAQEDMQLLQRCSLKQRQTRRRGTG